MFIISHQPSGARRGYLLIESMVAVTLVVVGLLGIFSLLSRSLSLNRVVSDRYAASALAGEGAEIIKNLIDNNVLASRAWNDGLAAGRYQMDYTAVSLPPPCASACVLTFYFDPARKIYSYAPEGKQTSFNRVMVIAPQTDADGSTQALTVNSIVSWTSRGGGRFRVNVEDHFYNYR